MSNSQIINKVKSILLLLIDKNYQQLVDNDAFKRLTAFEIETAFAEFDGGCLTMLPNEYWETMDIYYSDVVEGEVYVDVDLWFDNQLSDLTLQLTLTPQENTIVYGIDDIRVL